MKQIVCIPEIFASFTSSRKFVILTMIKSFVWTIFLPLGYLAYSLPLFIRLYSKSQNVIDEEFHLRQGLHYCNKRFDVWDPKITTFPGLYMMAVLLSPFDLCNVFFLRSISLVAGAVNTVLFYKIRRRLLVGVQSHFVALEAFTLSALPPLYFFNHLYYSDTLSLTFVLLFYYYWLKEKHLNASVYAAAAVLVRQTNITWLCMAFGITALDTVCNKYAQMKRIPPKQVEFYSYKTWLEILKSFKLLAVSVWETIKKTCFYIIIIMPFVGFIILNGSIVLGDKRAHEATLHLPQLFYFSVFAMIFGVTNSLHNLRPAISMLWREKLIALFLLGVFVIIVKWNTLVHPYLLADNRHYTFYVWNRLYKPYQSFRYLMTPVYLVALTLLYLGMRKMRESFKLMFWIAVVMTLCFQRLLEVRYFLTPFVLFRLHTRPPLFPKQRAMLQWLELSFYIGLNALTFYIFFTKEIKWTNFKEPQRIIW